MKRLQLFTASFLLIGISISSHADSSVNDEFDVKNSESTSSEQEWVWDDTPEEPIDESKLVWDDSNDQAKEEKTKDSDSIGKKASDVLKDATSKVRDAVKSLKD